MRMEYRHTPSKKDNKKSDVEEEEEESEEEAESEEEDEMDEDASPHNMWVAPIFKNPSIWVILSIVILLLAWGEWFIRNKIN